MAGCSVFKIFRCGSGRSCSGPFAVALLLLLSLSAIPSRAGLLSVDLFADGDGLLTFDTRTRLYWLDLSVTDGWSIDEALANPFVMEAGFDVADASQVDALLEGVGFPPELFDPERPELLIQPSGPEVRRLFFDQRDVLGATRDTNVCAGSVCVASTKVNGLFRGGLGPGSVGSSRSERLSVTGSVLYTFAFDPTRSAFDSGSSDEDYGVYLVRAADREVPAPSVAALLLAGLLASMRSRQRFTWTARQRHLDIGQ